MTSKLSLQTAVAALILFIPATVLAQEQQPPQQQQPQLPDIEVIQQQAPAPQQAAPQPKPKPKPKPVAAAPKPQSAAPVEFDEPIAEISEPAQILANSPYGSSAGAGAAQRAQFGSISPINATQALPGDLQNFTSAGTRIDGEALAEQRPINNHDALSRVPGVIIVADDGAGRISGIGIRGAPARRSRKVLVLEDGLPINYSTYLDASTHYTPPTERLESIEVVRGPVVNYGPLTNHGVVNFRNLSPFGENETLLKFGLGYTDGSDKSINNFRYAHTRQTMGNVGVVASYAGSEAAGAWDNEELRYNDFYGALGFKGSNQDLTIAGHYYRQRDKYDEINFVPDDEDTGLSDFFANGRNKSGSPFFFDGSAFLAGLSTFNADHYRVSATHNLYVDDKTTVTSRIYYSDVERNRFFVNADRGGFDEASFFMRGRERSYSYYGADSRVEFADLPFFAGTTQDVQAGIRYERHEFTNCNTFGQENEVLDSGTSGRCDIFLNSDPDLPGNGDRSRRADLDTNAFAAFVQTAIHVTKTLTVTPGLRFEDYTIDRNVIRADAAEDEGFSTSDHSNVLPMVGFAWEALSRTTVYGGYHQGITPQITRGPAFPLPDEKGDNYQIGVRSTAFRGLSFDVAYFHSDIENYQVKSPNATAGGANIFGAVDEVQIDGVELGVRLDTQPLTGGPWNVFAETVYTYADAKIERGLSDDGDDISGNRVPESPRQSAALTLGIAHAVGWDASITASYRGDFFTDTENEFELEVDDGEVESGFVEDVWLLSARSNLKLTKQLSLFITGTNLTDKFYLTDIDEGLKPGQGRTVMGGVTIKFD